MRGKFLREPSYSPWLKEHSFLTQACIEAVVLWSSVLNTQNGVMIFFYNCYLRVRVVQGPNGFYFSTIYVERSRLYYSNDIRNMTGIHCKCVELDTCVKLKFES